MSTVDINTAIYARVEDLTRHYNALFVPLGIGWNIKFLRLASSDARSGTLFEREWTPGVVFNTTRKGPDKLVVPIVTRFVPIMTKY
jgi:hypothetical protein